MSPDRPPQVWRRTGGARRVEVVVNGNRFAGSTSCMRPEGLMRDTKGFCLGFISEGDRTEVKVVCKRHDGATKMEVLYVSGNGRSGVGGSG